MRAAVASSTASCHDEAGSRERPRAGAVVALVGSPNSGKTTLFNWLTGSQFKTVNYPGSTVDYSLGQSQERYGEPLKIMDTPGTYSLHPKSPDEQVTINAIFSHPIEGAAGVVISVADATLLSRQLYVTKQLKSAGFKVVLALTMSDLLKEKGERLECDVISQALGVPVVLIDGRLGGGLKELLDCVRDLLAQPQSNPISQPKAWKASEVENALRSTADIAARAVTKKSQPTGSSARERTREIDKVLLHPIWGLLIFFILMSGLFSGIFWVAKPVMEGIDHLLTFFSVHMLALAPDNLAMQFLCRGVIASASAVLVFAPQIFILFLGIILLEDSGYLARSATLVDRPLSKLGMGGRSFVPLLSGFACAVPAMMAARAINSRRERWLTLFILPLMSCSARLPVYALLLTFLFRSDSAWKAGIALAVIYATSILVGGIAALVASRFLKIEDRSFFMLELPVYRKPKFRLVARQAFMRTKSYVRRAGPAIFVFALIVWGATTFPRYDVSDRTEQLNQSYAASAGRALEPVFEPMGGDWRVGVGLISAFAAREVFVSALAVLFQLTDQDESTLQESLLTKMREARNKKGALLFTPASVVGLILFFMIALQCLSTVTVAFKESGAWRFALLQLVLFNAVAYIVAVAVVQGLRSVGVS